MTAEQQREVKMRLLLEHAETQQALFLHKYQLQDWARDLSKLAHALITNPSEAQIDHALFDVEKLELLRRELGELEQRFTEL